MSSKKSPATGKNDSAALPFFVAAVFVITLPRMGDGRWLPFDPWVSIAAGMFLTALGFWFLLRGRRSSP